MNRGAWRATVHTVTKRQTQLRIQSRAGSLDGKESACDAGDPGLTPGSGRFPGEGNGYPRLYFLPSAFCSLLFMTPQRTLNSSLQPMDEYWAIIANIFHGERPILAVKVSPKHNQKVMV